MNNEVDIVLIEDNPQDAEMTQRALKKYHLANHLVWLKDGAKALEYFLGSNGRAQPPRSHRPKVILLDLKLPKVDGLDVLRQLKAHPQTKMFPVVVLTSSREEQDIVESYRLGVNSYIVKPVHFANFAEAVGKVGLYWLLLNQPPELP